MTEWTRIRATLNRASQVGKGHAQPRDLRALLTCFNRTVMPRRISLGFRSGGQVHFHVGNRRLHRLETGGKNMPPWNIPLDPSWLGAVCEALGRLPSAHDWDLVLVPTSDGAACCEGLGISALDLLQAATPETRDDTMTDLEARVATFSEKHSGQIEASFLMAENAIAPLTGPAETVDRIHASVSGLLSQGTNPVGSLAAELETDGVLVLPRAPADAGAILIAGEVGLLGIVVARDWTPVDTLAHWRAHDIAESGV